MDSMDLECGVGLPSFQKTPPSNGAKIKSTLSTPLVTPTLVVKSSALWGWPEPSYSWMLPKGLAADAVCS